MIEAQLVGLEPVEVLRRVDIREACALLYQVYECVEEKLSSECSAEEIASIADTGAMETWTQIAAGVEIVCDNADVFNEYKNCLLRPGTGGEDFALSPAIDACVLDVPASQMQQGCIPSGVVGCIKSAVTEQCGEQVGLISEQLMLSFGETCYRSEKWRRGLVEYLKNSLFK